MDNPLLVLNEVFHPTFHVNLSIERLDGSLTLTLSNDEGVVSKHLISPHQRSDRQLLQRLIEQIQQQLDTGPASQIPVICARAERELHQPGTVGSLPAG